MDSIPVIANCQMSLLNVRAFQLDLIAFSSAIEGCFQHHLQGMDGKVTDALLLCFVVENWGSRESCHVELKLGSAPCLILRRGCSHNGSIDF